MAVRLFSALRNSARLAGLAALIALAGARLALADGYFAAVPDLPLPARFTEDPAAEVRFEAGPVRILELGATGPAGIDIQGFYRETLPMLGWVAEGGGRYVRGAERLSLAIQTAGNGQILTIRIEPKP